MIDSRRQSRLVHEAIIIRKRFWRKEYGEEFIEGVVETGFAALVIGTSAVINPGKTVPPLAKLAAHSLERGVGKAVHFGRFVSVHAEAAMPVVSEVAHQAYYMAATAAAIAVILPIALVFDIAVEDQ